MAGAQADLRAAFCEALDRKTPQARADYLDLACAGKPELRSRLEALLRAHEEASGFLAEPAPSPAGTVAGAIREGPGTIIGAYKLLEQIGEGGFGLVFMAEQQQPVRRKVAVKVLKPGMDTRQVIARFEAERQALALMDHPNIARVLEASATETGRPYFAMELVRGVPITDYCDQNRLDTRERLELFMHVCQAVQHAHHKGIIHRDIKPSNVMVTLHDDVPVVKVIDFGIAKALGQQLTDKTLYTAFAQLVGTPLYMSPEQAQLSGLDIDTRSDIYSLGVLLYELLTGTTPFDKERLRTAGYDEMRRVIREEDPPKPSTRVSTLGQAAATVSERRQSNPRGLSRLFRGELDWIVMKALEKDRNRRYETASAFAVDLDRYLKDEPVAACPPSARYRLGKFARRNRGPVVAASLVLLALVVGVIGTSFGLLQARNATDAERLSKETAQRRLTQIEKANEILGSIFKDLNPQAAEKEDKPLQALLGERLDQASAQLEGEVIGDPLAVARMQLTLGESQLGLGYAEKGIHLLSKARMTFTAQLGPDHPDTLRSMSSLAEGYKDAGRLDLALPLQEETLKRRKAQLGPDHPDTLTSMNNLAWCYQTVDKLEKALPLYEETLKRRNAQLGPDHPDTLESMNNLAVGYQLAGKLEKALPLYEETLKRRKAKLPSDHPQTLYSMNCLAWGYEGAGKLEKALPLYEETLKLHMAKLGPEHAYTLKVMNNLGRAYIRVGNTAKAEPLLRKCLAIDENKEPDAWTTFDAKSLLGAALLGQKEYAEAEPLLLAGYQGMQEREAKIPRTYRVRLIEDLERLVQLYEATGNKEKAKAWQKKLAEAKDKRKD
jgi:eukaryotic-like serine/threonine-protein kinase